MKRAFIQILTLLAGLALLFSCEKQTTPEPVRIQYPDKQSPFPRDDAYYARLRAYKKTDHKLAFGWYGSWTGIGASEQSRLRSAPDSMDIISIWSQWHSLSPEQIEDKAFVQQVKGTKVVFCISAKDMPEEFKVNGQITEVGIVAYAKAWGKDSMDKYQYDGMDIDFETASDHIGPMNQNPENFKKFAEELSKYIGPKSGTGRLFLIDGNIDSDWLPANIGELCDYAVSQAYNCYGAANLRQRTSNAASRSWRPEQIIFTENFESLWQTGGANYSYNGQTIPSLLGMAYFAMEETSCGFGAYHMEYEYGNAEMPYKYMRQAIQIANPAPQGDYSKNLLTLDQAGEMSVNLVRFPSGATEAVAVSLTGSLSGFAATDMTIPLVLDPSLVQAYNEYNYTDYEAIDPANVSFSGSFHFAAGSRHSSEELPVRMTITGGNLEPGKSYLAVVRADHSGIAGVASNTASEILYVKVSVSEDTKTNSVGLTGKQIENLEIVALCDGTLIETGTCELGFSLQYGASEDVTFALDVDPTLVEQYNKTHGTSYQLLSVDKTTRPESIVLRQGEKTAPTITIGVRDPETLENGDYMIAYRIDLGNSDDYWLYDESQLTRYVIISKSQTNVEEKVDSVDGTIIEDRTGWKYTANGTDYSEDMFDGDLKDGWTVFTDETPEVKVEVDMASVRTIVGWRMGFIDYSFKQLRDVAVSVDGQKWESQASGDVELALTEGNWRYLQLRSPVECRYIRMTIIPYSWAYNSCEFEAYAPKN